MQNNIQDEHRRQLEDLAEIRAIMERSTRFLSLSGLSGVWAGCCALAGIAVVFAYLELRPFGPSEEYYYLKAVDTNKWGMDYKSVFMLLAIMVLATALSGGYYFTTRKARRRGDRVWDAASRRMTMALFIPLFAGGIFGLAMLFRGYLSLLAPSTLIFYGLALVNAAKYTLSDVGYLGLLNLGLGLIGIWYPGYGLELWAAGFGLLHILYGWWMYQKYDQQT